MFSDCIVLVLSSYNRREDDSIYNLYLYKINQWHLFISEINMINYVWPWCNYMHGDVTSFHYNPILSGWSAMLFSISTSETGIFGKLRQPFSKELELLAFSDLLPRFFMFIATRPRKPDFYCKCYLHVRFWAATHPFSADLQWGSFVRLQDIISVSFSPAHRAQWWFLYVSSVLDDVT